MGIPQLLAFLSRSQNCFVSCGLKNSNKTTLNLKYPNISHKKFSYEKYQKNIKEEDENWDVVDWGELCELSKCDYKKVA